MNKKNVFINLIDFFSFKHMRIILYKVIFYCSGVFAVHYKVKILGFSGYQSSIHNYYILTAITRSATVTDSDLSRAIAGLSFMWSRFLQSSMCGGRRSKCGGCGGAFS